MILLDGSSLTIEQVIAIADDHEPVGIAADAAQRVTAARAVVDRTAAGDTAVYGVNTGFGSLAEVKIAAGDLDRLQVNLLRSHAAGVGELLAPRVVRAMMALRANVLAKGYSGIRLETLEALLALLNHRVHPAVPSRGSVGASGDLAPLAHLALVLIGEGDVLADADGANGSAINTATPTWKRFSGSEGLRRAGLSPVVLHAKEGLALINGTQASVALLVLALVGAERLARAADVAAAMSVDALRGSAHPFESRIHDARPFRGQMTSAANIAALLAGSAINKSHEHCGRVQDAYSLRCTPQVHGAARDALSFVRQVATVEANAATDNPMVFADAGEMVSGGNFHGAPVAIAADLLAIAVAQFATISERRSDRLVNASLSGLPPFLTEHSGLHSGFMLAQVTAAALASEVKGLAHPASVDTIPTSANREDHVSMSMGAGLKAQRAVELAQNVTAVELLCACQAIDLLAPLTTSTLLARVHARIREDVARLVDDRPLAPDIERIASMIAEATLQRTCGQEVK